MSFLATPGLGRYVNKKTGIFDKIGSALFGNEDRNIQQPTINPEQQQALSQYLSQMNGPTGQNFNSAQNYLGKILSGDQGAYNMFASPYLQNFEQQIVPRIAERFAGLGGGLGGGTMGSSGFGQALGGAGAQLQSQLAGLFANLQQNAASQATNQYNTAFNQGIGVRPFENQYQPGTGGIFGGLLQGAGQGAGQAGGMAGMMKLLPLLGLI